MQDQSRYRSLLDKFTHVRVLVVGDIYLDESVFGAVTEISLEAPIPVFEVHERRYNPGAAGNAACNAASLGAKVWMVGAVGADTNGEIVRREFEKRSVDASNIVIDPQRPTNTYGKLRAGGHNIPMQEVLRTDTPKPAPISGATERAVIDNIQKLAPQVDAIMIGDQVSSTITQPVLAAISAAAREHKLFTLADSRRRAGMFKDIDIIVPNDKEAGIGAGIDVVDEESLQRAGHALLKTARNVMITQGPKGITIFAAGGAVKDVPIQPVTAIDVTGAGDTVAAAVTLAMCSGATLEDAAFLGNTAAGIAVAQEGVVTVSRAEVEHALFAEQTPSKVKTRDELTALVERLRREGKRVVWTNGCFDILHVGHITYLLQARRQGDLLIVGLNSDASVKANKGDSRPVINERHRAQVLAALDPVDFIVIFDDKTPLPLLEALHPDIYAKGGDYTLDSIVQEERRLIESYGGKIAIIPGVEGHGTTHIIEKIQSFTVQ